MSFLLILPPLFDLFFLIGLLSLILTLVRERRSQNSQPQQIQPIGVITQVSDQVKEARETLAFALVFTVVVGGPAILLSGLLLLLSNNQTLAAVAYFLVFVTDLFAIYGWSKRRSAPRNAATALADAQEDKLLSVHEFIAQMKMHPELLPEGVTEFDLERLRRRDGQQKSQADHGTWREQLINGGVYGQPTE